MLLAAVGVLAIAEPRTLHYRLLHAAVRLVHPGRQVWLRLPEHWPLANDPLAAYHRLTAITGPGDREPFGRAV